jgi:hypothetical protein
MRTEPPRVTRAPDYGPRAEWENLVLLEALQASQGQISESVRGLAVEVGLERDPYFEPTPTIELRVHVGHTD